MWILRFKHKSVRLLQFMLADIPQVRTYINTYDSKDNTLDALVEKLVAGVDAFTGKDPIDSFCGLFDSRL